MPYKIRYGILFTDCDQIGRESSIKKRLGESHPNAVDYYTLLAVPTLERSRGNIFSVGRQCLVISHFPSER